MSEVSMVSSVKQRLGNVEAGSRPGRQFDEREKRSRDNSVFGSFGPVLLTTRLPPVIRCDKSGKVDRSFRVVGQKPDAGRLERFQQKDLIRFRLTFPATTCQPERRS
jgi:hypothetical protein